MSWLRMVVAALLGGLLLGSLPALELKALDALFVVRYLVHGPRPVDPRLVILGIDEPTMQAFGKPLILWQPELAQVLNTLTEAGAQAIGLDLSINPVLSKLSAEDPLVVRLEDETRQLALAVSGAPVILIGLTPEAGVERESNALYLLAESQGKLGAPNLATDPDGVVRRVPSEGTFSGRLAELATGRPPALPGTFRIDYPGPSGTIPTRSLSDGLGGLKGKICLLGLTADSSQDLQVTPFNLLGRYMKGIEVQAAALNTLLAGRTIQPVSWATGVLLTALVFLGCALMALRWSRARALAGCLTLLGAYLVAAELLFASQGWWLPVVGPALASLVGFAAGNLERVLTLEKDRGWVKGVLERFVSPQVMENLLKDPKNVELGGTSMRVTVLFSDINDFTPVCEGKTPAEVMELLNTYFEDMVGICFRYGGMVKQFVGDEIMVIFGAPEPQPDQAVRAIYTALDMLELLAKRRQEANGAPGFFDVKIGINTGDVVVGRVGSARRMEYAAVGDSVNLGARIEGLTKKLGADLLVSESTRQEAAGAPDLEFIPYGPQSFKGKTQQIEVYGVRRKGGKT